MRDRKSSDGGEDAPAARRPGGWFEPLWRRVLGAGWGVFVVSFLLPALSYSCEPSAPPSARRRDCSRARSLCARAVRSSHRSRSLCARAARAHTPISFPSIAANRLRICLRGWRANAPRPHPGLASVLVCPRRGGWSHRHHQRAHQPVDGGYSLAPQVVASGPLARESSGRRRGTQPGVLALVVCAQRRSGASDGLLRVGGVVRVHSCGVLAAPPEGSRILHGVVGTQEAVVFH